MRSAGGDLTGGPEFSSMSDCDGSEHSDGVHSSNLCSSNVDIFHDHDDPRQ
jgi:hypothetical protein